jgi:hypothetical protein
MAWCDPGLAAAYETATTASVPPTPARPGGWFRARPQSIETLRQDAIRERQAKLRAAAEAEKARCWAALLADFRARVGTGEIRLTGLQLSPNPARERAHLPPVWATKMKLLPFKGRVTLGDAVFVDVTAERAREADLPVPAQISAVTPVVAPSVAEDELPRPRRKPGRKPTDDLIRGALLARWDCVAAEAAKASRGRPSMQALANALRRDLQRRYAKQSEKKLPQVGTIRKNLPAIYDDLVREIACGKSKPAQ